MHKRIILAAVTAAALSIPASAATEKASFRLTSTVHTVCRVLFGIEAVSNERRIDFGNVEQVCNSRNGFRVMMVHPANMRGAAFVMGSRRIPLSQGNETIIIDENHPIFAVQDAQLDLGDSAETPPMLSFRIEPKGPIF